VARLSAQAIKYLHDLEELIACPERDDNILMKAPFADRAGGRELLQGPAFSSCHGSTMASSS
jgi:hypothetical protein